MRRRKRMRQRSISARIADSAPPLSLIQGSFAMKKMKHTYIAVVIIAAIAIAAGIIIIGSRNGGSKPIEVQLAAVTRGPLEDRISASGSFQAERYSVVASQTYGIVKKVYVKPGDHVEKGDLIVVVDEREAREALEAAEIALEEIRRNIAVQLTSLRGEIRTATVAVDQTKRALKNAESLKDVDGISGEDFRKASEAFAQAQSTLDDAYDRLRVLQGIESDKVPSIDPKKDPEVIDSSPAYRKAKLSVASARRIFDGCIFRADIAGTVTEMDVSQGDRLKEETTIVARIEDPTSVKAEVNVDEVDIGKIREGMKAEVTADSMLGKKIEGTVIRIWPIVKTNGSGRVCLVRIAINLDGKKIISGASCMARITSTIRENALTIPATALIPGAQPAAVWLAVEQTANKTNNADAAKTETFAKNAKAKGKGSGQKTYKVERREIEIGESTVSTIEVVSGLKANDIVIVDQLALINPASIVTNGNE